MNQITVIVLFIALLISGCTESNTSSASFDLTKGEYTGTFSVTFNNYKNQSTKLVQNGTLNMVIHDSTYLYFAQAITFSDSTAKDTLYDRGLYTKLYNKIVMNDLSWMFMDPSWHPSLYLKDTFAVSVTGNQITISQNNSFASWVVDLIPKQ